jgi:hypothetical protein
MTSDGVAWTAARGAGIWRKIDIFATIRGGLGGHVEKKNKNKSRGGVASWRFVVYQRF